MTYERFEQLPVWNDAIDIGRLTFLLTANRVFNLSPIVGAGLAFVLITIPLARFTDWLVRRDQARMRGGS